VIHYDISSVLQSEVMCRYKVIEFIRRRVKTKKGEKEAEKLKNEIEQINVWIKKTEDIIITVVNEIVENIVQLMIAYMKKLHHWDNLT